jgi:polyisoprenoid-binding protein YceI
MKISVRILAVALIACSLGATAAQFNFKDPKGVNTVTFSLDAPLEAIEGSANGISGEVEFDPAKPAATTGRIVVDTATLHVPNPTMKQHLHGKDWMDVARFPTLTFEAETFANVRTEANAILADVTGTLTIKGVSRKITVPVRMTHLPDKLAARTNGMLKGDLLVLRTKFPIKRSDFEINPGAPADKVADEIQLSLSVAGAAPKS